MRSKTFLIAVITLSGIFCFEFPLYAQSTAPLTFHLNNSPKDSVRNNSFSEESPNGSTNQHESSRNVLSENNIYHPSIDDGTVWRVHSDINKTRLYGFFGTLAVFDIVGYFRLKELQYDAPTSNFHFTDFSDDLRKNKQMDKYGHIFDGYFSSHFASKAYRWSGLSAKKSIIYGSVTGWLLFLQVEMADAFFDAWGFSTGDLIGNTIGVGFSALQQLYPKPLQGVRLKISYQPSEAHKQGLYSAVSSSKLDDYEGRTHWLSFTIYDFLPEKWQSGYPGWLKPLALTVGQSVNGIALDVWGGEREIFIGLDIDLNKIPTGRNSFLKILKDELNLIRLPLPAVRMTPRGTWYGFYF